MATLSTLKKKTTNQTETFQPLVEYIKKREIFKPDAFSTHRNDFEEDKTVAFISLSPGNSKVFGPANSIK